MALPLPEYRVLRPIRESSRSCVYEAVRERDGHVVIAKVFDIEGEADEDRVQREFGLIRSLEIEGVVRALDLLRVGDQLVLLLERVPGEDLAEFAKGHPLPLDVFFSIAIPLTEILARTHAARVVHRDIKPANILIDPITKQVHLADFGISVLLEHERRHIYDSEVFVGTLPYISPEQTGRTSRSVDFRSDLYSLGVTFYELLTGCRPFENLAPLDLIHAHLAREADPPIVLRSDLPLSLSRLVMKLLAKAPEHRYQTAAGLGADLRMLQAAIAAGDHSLLTLGSEDVVTTLRLPHQLYGRERERRELLDAFAETVSSGRRRTVVVSGPAGCGKTALTNELAAAVAGRGGYLVRGEFRHDGELPLAGLAEAFTGLFEQLLTESDARLERWRRLLLGGLGNLAGVIAEFAPSFSLVVGKLPPAPTLSALETSNRLLVAVERLLAVVCANGPLVLVLDDLQHAGLGALRVLEGLVDGEQGPLVLLLALREDELHDEHPLRPLMDGFAQSSVTRRIALAGLSPAAVESLVADALPGASSVHQLAQIIARRTNGLPLFVRQLLERLFERGILEPSKNAWSWDQAAVEAEPLPEDAVAMMRAKLAQLSARLGLVIGRAACIGPRFEVARLAPLCELEREQLGGALLELEDLGMLVRSGLGYRFAHESIRTAAYASVPEHERRRLHWTIGQSLLATVEHLDKLGSAQLFELADHLDAGAPDELDDALSRQLAVIDLHAGRRALANAAHDIAHRYLSTGIDHVDAFVEPVLMQGDVLDDYELVFGLHFALAQALALAGRRAAADVAFAQLLGWTLTQRDYGSVIARRLELLWAESRNIEGIELALSALAKLGATVPREPGHEQAREQLTRSWQHFRGFDRAAIEAMPRCEDPLRAAVIDVVAQTKYLAFVLDNALFLYIVGLHAQLIAIHGYHDTCARALSDLAIGVGGALGHVADSVALHELGYELARAHLNESSAARLVAIGGALTLHRGRPFADVIARFDSNYALALEAGEFNTASFLGGFGANMQFEVGTHLRVVERRVRQITNDVGRWCSAQMRMTFYVMRGFIAALTESEPVQVDAVRDDAVWDLDPEQILARNGARSIYATAKQHRAMIALLRGDAEDALRVSLDAAPGIETLLFNTFYLARAWLLLSASESIQRLAGVSVSSESMRASERALDGLTRWAEAEPSNYGHYLDFALGLRQAVEGRSEQAIAHLDRAWSGARQRGCRWLEGLAAEQLAAQFERQGLRAPVEGVMLRAWEAFAAWGAEAKLAQLRVKHPGLFTDVSRRREVRRGNGSSDGDDISSSRTPVTGFVQASPGIDLARVLRSVGAISEDLRLEEVIGRVLDAALTNVGADHGLLVLDQGGELALVAEAESIDDRKIFPDPPLLRDAATRAPVSLVNFVARTGQSVVLDDAREDLRFAGDPYLEGSEVRSILALPLHKGERRLGVLVLENHLTTHGFAASSIEALRMITSQAASTLENAQLYAALRASDARWRSLVDGAPDLIALLDERGAMVFRNHAGPLRGIDETDESDSEGGALEPESAARWREAVNRVITDGERCELELAYRPTIGPLQWYAVRLAPIEVHRGLRDSTRTHRRNAVAVATDITERKQAEAEKRELEAQLRQQQRLESVGTLASGVAHEINNPIQGIMNYADLIFTNSTDRELVEDFANEINHESHRVAKIVRNLLAFSRQQDASDDPEPNHLVDVVESSLSLIRSVLRSDHIDVQVHADPTVPPVRCRAQQIQQIIMNLVTNARDALNQRYGEYHERKRIEVNVSRSPREGWVRLSVRDHGPGIPPEVLPRIFDPFFTTKGRDQGTGLGLAVSHGIAQEHGGDLSVETTPGEGTCFMLDLPATRD